MNKFKQLFSSGSESDLDKELQDLDKEINIIAKEENENSASDSDDIEENNNSEPFVEEDEERNGIKNIFKKRSKYETSEDKQKQIKGKATKIYISGIFIGILVLAIAAAVVLFMRESVNNVNRTMIDQNETKFIAFDTSGNNNYWRYQTNNKINKIEKKMESIQEENQKDLNRTKYEIQASLSDFAKDLENQISNSNNLVLSKVDTVENNFKKREAEIRKYTDDVKKELSDSFKDYSATLIRPAATGDKVVFTPNQKMLPIPGGGNRNFGNKVDMKTVENMPKTVKKAKITPEAFSAMEKEKMLADTEIFSISMDDSVDYAAVFDEKYNTDSNETEPSLHIMTGFAEATLITGVSAPTFGEGVENPKPVLLSINSELVVANNDTENLKDCFLVGTATGNMNSSRAEIIVNRLSCSAEKDGKTYKIEQEASPLGWVIGEDGQYGLKGRLVDSAGKLLMRQLSVGFLQGVSMAFSTPNVGALPTTSGMAPAVDSQMLQNSFNSGVGYGIGSALDSLAEYYKKMLDGMYPYVSIKAGRAVTILFQGFQDTDISEYKSIDVDIQEEDYYGIESEEIEISYQGF